MSAPTPIEVIPQRENIQENIMQLSLKDQEILLGWLKATIKEGKQSERNAEIPLKKGRELVETLRSGSTIYRLEKVKCGKKKCKCRKGNLHGPYWYSYHWNGKKITSAYIGKKLDEAIATGACHLLERK
jgi:hypothetical protein